MVDVPTPQEPLTQMPTSRVTAGDIQSTYNTRAQQVREGDLSQGVKSVAEGMEEAAVPLAQAAGEQAVQKAVTRNADGSINVDTPATSFILGRAGQAYQRTVSNGMEAALRTKMDQDITDLRQKYSTDPEGFAKAAGAYVDGQRDQYGGQVGNAIWQYGLGVSAQHRDSIVNHNASTEVQGAINAQDARLKQLENQLDGLAGQGDTTSPQYRAAAAERASILDKQVADSASTGYTQDHRDVDDKNFATRLSAASAAGTARDYYQKTGNLAAAQTMFDKAVEGLPLSVEQKFHYMGEINSHLRSTDALRQQQNSDFRDSAQALKERALATGKVDPQELENWARQADARNLPKVAGDLRGLSQYIPFSKVILGGTPEQSATAMNQLVTLQNAKVNNAAAGIHLPAQDRDLAIRTIYGEAGGESPEGQIAVAHVIRTRVLSGNYGPDTASVIKEPWQFSVWNRGDPAGNVARSLSPNDPAYKRIGEYVDGVFGGTLPDPTKGADHYYNPNVANPAWGNPLAARNDVSIGNHRFVGGNGPSVPPTAPMFHEYVKLAQANYNKHANDLWNGIDKAFDGGNSPTPQELSDLKTMAPYITDDKLIEKVNDRLQRVESKRLIQGLGNLDAENNSVQTLKVLAAKGGLDNIGRQTLADLDKDHVRDAKMAATDPVTYGQIKTPDVVAQTMPKPAPINWSDPNAASAGIAANRQWLGIGRQLGGNVAGNSPLTAADTTALAGVLQNRDGKAVGTALSAINSGAKPEEIDAILHNDDVRSALTGAARSDDPGKFSAAMSFLSEQKKRNPAQFDAQFPDMKKEVFAYEDLQRFMPQDELVQKLQKFNDPAEVQTRQRNGSVADKYLEKVDAPAVASKFGGWLTKAGTPAGVDDQSGALKTDYDSAYKEMFELTGDQATADKYATTQLATMWGVSPTQSSRVMRLPPEKYVPQIAGSTDWVRHQFRDDVAKLAGSQGVPVGTEGAFGMEAGGPQVMATTEAEQRAQDIVGSALLMPRANKNGSTEADIAAHRMPGYHVSVVLGDGRRTVLTDANNQPYVWHPDPAAAQAKWGEGFDATQRAAAERRATRPTDPFVSESGSAF